MPSQPPSFRIATLNLLNYAEPPAAFYEDMNMYTAEQWRQKQAWTARLIKEMTPDMLGMQEVFSPGALKQQCRELALPHFALSEIPAVEDDYLFRHPVLALASRYPILHAEAVKVSPIAAGAVGMPDNFSFSRAPLRAQVCLPGLGTTRIYVVHFKSARPIWDEPVNTSTSLATDPSSLEPRLFKPVLGGWAAVMQRGAEATLLIHDMLTQQLKQPMPTLILGDFNDELDSAAFRALAELNRAASKDPGPPTNPDDLSQPRLADLSLQDVFALTLDGSEPRPTHYWGASGRRLDNILVSAEFDPSNPLSHAQVDQVRIYDRHLLCSDIELDRQCSDHAAVLAQISVRS